MSVNVSIGLVGIAEQANKSTPATEPSYVHGLTGGSPFGFTRTVEALSVACGVRSKPGAYVSEAEVAPNYESYCYADALGLYLKAMLGVCETVAGTGVEEGTGNGVPTGYYKHTFTMGDVLPYLTIFGQVGSNNITVAEGCKLSESEISFEGNGPLSMSTTWSGIGADFSKTSMPGELEPSCFDGQFMPTDCTFNISTDSTAASAAVITQGNFSFNNNVEGFRTIGQVIPSEVMEGALTAGCSVTVIPDDLGLYRRMVTGSATGTEPSGKVVYGSVYAKFIHSDDQNMTLEFKADRVPFNADYFEVDPEGTAGEMEFSCDEIMSVDKDTSPITVTLVNQVASYDLD